jgi:hypothetical protein
MRLTIMGLELMHETYTLMNLRKCFFSMCACLFLSLTSSEAVLAKSMEKVGDLNGHWELVDKISDDFETASKQLNRQMMKDRRLAESENQQFDRKKPKERNKYQSQRAATERQIAKESINKYWGGPDEQMQIMQAKEVKIHVGRKVIILYDSLLKRLLTINPLGRAYSYSGTEVTRDLLGSSLTYSADKKLIIETTGITGIEFSEHYYLEPEKQYLVQELNVQDDQSSTYGLKMIRYFTRAGRE